MFIFERIVTSQRNLFCLGLMLVSFSSLTQAMSEEKLVDVKEVIRSEFKEAATERLIEYVTGLNASDSLSSSIENFLPDFQLANLLRGGDVFGDKDEVVIDFSFLLGREGGDHNNKIKAIVNRNAEVSKDILTAFAIQDSARFGNLGALDDIEYSFSYSLNNQYFGRSPAAHSDTFQRLVSSEVNLSHITKIENEFHSKALKLLSDFNDVGISGVGFSINNFNLTLLSPERKSEFKVRFLEIKNESLALERLFIKGLIKPQLANFSQLVSNQPQLIFSGSYRDRNELVGPDEVSLSVKYERGLTNINSLRRNICSSKTCEINLESYKEQFNSKKFNNNLNAANRVYLGLEYSDIDDHEFVRAASRYFKKGGAKITGKAGYARNITLADNGTPLARVDVGLSYEEFLKNAEGNDRLIATIAYTRKLSENVSLPITLEYANKSAFLSDEGKQFGGNIGIKWDFVTAK